MARKWKTVRVFISSTFNDMQAERDYLVKVVFPELREKLEKHRVHLVDIDLRWGVTAEQVDNGMVVELCLDEINRCSPFFIGIVGQRYGSIIEKFPDEAIKKYNWLRDMVGKSIMELEILYAMRHNQERNHHAMFFFRQPGFLPGVSESIRHRVFLDEHHEKLSSLKTGISNYCKRHGTPLREYSCRWEPDKPNLQDGMQGRIGGLEAFGEWIKKDLWEAITSEYPGILKESSTPAYPGTGGWWEEEEDFYERFIESRLQAYVERTDIQNRLNDYLTAETSEPLVLSGGSGVGKSSILANLSKNLAPADTDLILIHFVGASPTSTDMHSMLLRFCELIKHTFDVPMDIPDAMNRLPVVFRSILGHAPEDRRVIIIIDAVNQLDQAGPEPGMAWLPVDLPGNIKIILSCTEEADRPHPELDILRKRNIVEVKVGPLTYKERIDILKKRPSISAKNLDVRQMGMFLDNPATENPLFLTAALEELRAFGSFAKLDQAILSLPRVKGAPGIDSLFIRIVQRLEQELAADVVRRTLGYIAASRKGLAEKELAELLVEDKEISEGDESERSGMMQIMLRQLRPYLLRRGQFVDFYHQNLLEAVIQQFCPNDDLKKQFHRELADYFSRDPLQPQRIREFPWQLLKAGDWKRLVDYLSDLSFLAAVWDVDQYDAKGYWAFIEAYSPLRMVNVYGLHLKRPPKDYHHTWILSMLMADAGHLEEAKVLRQYQVNLMRKAGDRRGLSATLGNLAITLTRHGGLNEALALHKEEEALCRELGDMAGLQASLSNQATIYKIFHRLEEAEDFNRKAVQICRAIGNKEGLAACLAQQADLIMQRGNLDQAMVTLEEAVRLCRETGNMDRLQLCLRLKAAIFEKHPDFDRVLALNKEAEQICRRIGNKLELARCLDKQALILMRRGKLDQAVTMYKEAEQLWRQLGNQRELAESLINQVVTLRRCREWDAAMTPIKAAEQIFRQLDDKHGLALCLGNQALVLKNQGRLDQAMIVNKEVERICIEAGDKQGLSMSYANQATILLEKGDYDEAMALYKKQEELCRQMNNIRDLSVCLFNQALILEQREDWTGRIKLLKEQEQLCRRLDDKEALVRTLSLQATTLTLKLRRFTEAMPLVEEAIQVAMDGGFTEEAMELKPLRDLFRQVAQRSHEEKTGQQEQEGVNHTDTQDSNTDTRESSTDEELERLNRLVALHIEREEFQKALTISEKQEQLSRQSGDVLWLRANLHNRATLYQKLSDYRKALELFKEHEDICRRLEDNTGLLYSLHHQADIYKATGELSAGIMVREKAAGICRQLGDMDSLQNDLLELGLMHQRRDESEAALAMYRECEEICRQTGNEDGLQRVLTNQSLLLRDLGQLDNAMEMLRESEELSRRLENMRVLQSTLGNQATIYHKLGQLEKALQKLEEKETISRRTGDMEGIQSSLGLQAIIYREAGAKDHAIKLLEEQEQICSRMGDPVTLAMCLGAQALVYQDQNQWDAALVLSKRAERIFRETKNKNRLSGCLINQANLLIQIGKTREAMSLYREAGQISRETGDKELLAASLISQAQVKDNLEGALAMAREAYGLAEELGIPGLTRKIKLILESIQAKSLQ